MSADPIGDYLTRLDHSLRRRPNRARLMEEAEDHLRESEASLIRRGRTPEQAALEAVDRMGPIESISRAGGGKVATAVVVITGSALAILLLASGVKTSGPGGDGPTPGFPLILFVGGIGIAIVTVAAVCAVRSWASGVATRGTTFRLTLLTLALAVAVGMAMLAVHEGKHQQGGTASERDQRALMALAIGAGVVAVTVWGMELHARRERDTLDAG